MELYPGTLDAIVLQILAARPLHGYAIARAIESRSDDLLSVDQGSLYPALYRMEHAGWIRSRRTTSESGRRVKEYCLTREGERQLEREVRQWKAFAEVMGKIMEGAT